MTSVSPPLYKDMSDGKLSFTKDDRDRRKINVAELDRLYDKREESHTGFTSANGKNGEAFTEPNVKHQQLSQQVKAIRDQIEQSKNREIELLERQIDQFKDQIENLHRHLDETREEHRIYVRLLEDKREEQGAKTSQWDEKLKLMEQQVAALQEQNRQLIAKEEERKKRIEERRRKREAEKLLEKQKSKNFFSQLFG
jgi:DNA repair exonuclease SbcCD ATPase subunit